MQNKVLAALAIASLSSAVHAQSLEITISNLTHGSAFTPLVVAAHDGSTHLFMSGSQASANLQAMAEGGDIAGLVADLNAASADITENPAAGLLAPGASTSFTLDTQNGNTQLSFAAMILPSNDGFVGLDSLTLPTSPGHYNYTVNAYDAGTEANDELITGGGAPGAAGIPANPVGESGMNGSGASGADQNNHIHIHRGILGDTDLQGGVSDLDSRVHRWLNPVAKITVVVN